MVSRARIFIPVSQLKDVSDDNCIVSGGEVARNICPEDGDDQSGHPDWKGKGAGLQQPWETILSLDVTYFGLNKAFDEKLSLWVLC